MLMTFFDVQCVIKEFKSDQLSVNQYDQSTLGDNFSHLGQDTLLGNGQQNCDFCLDVELGPLSTGQAPLFFKGNTKYAQLMFLTKAFLGPLYKVSYGINVIRNETDNIGMRLGFNTVLTPQKTSITYTVRL